MEDHGIAWHEKGPMIGFGFPLSDLWEVLRKQGVHARLGTVRKWGWFCHWAS